MAPTGGRNFAALELKKRAKLVEEGCRVICLAFLLRGIRLRGSQEALVFHLPFGEEFAQLREQLRMFLQTLGQN